jgi:hypothetical protein
MALRKAQKFVFDLDSSRKIAEFSFEIQNDLDGARQAARAPYPITWIEYNNAERLRHAKTLGVHFVQNDPMDGFDPVQYAGWLERHQTQHSAYRMTYVGDLGVQQGAKVNAGWRWDEAEKGAYPLYVSSWGWMWDVEGKDLPWEPLALNIAPHLVNQYLFGIHELQSTTSHVGFCMSYGRYKETHDTERLLLEFAGELRHVFGLLLALGSLPTIDHTIVRIDNPNEQPVAEPRKVGDKTILPFAYRTVTLRIPRLRDPNKVVQRVLEGIRKRRHGVRGHWRNYRDAQGNVVRRVWVNDHERGDASLGRVEHDYRVIAR